MRSYSLAACAAALAFLAACSDSPSNPAAAEEASRNTAQRPDAATGRVVPGQYIVRFRDDAADVNGRARAIVNENGGSLKYVYQHAIRGFAAALPPQAVEALRRNPQVISIEEDREVRGSACPDPFAYADAQQCNVPWGLDRIDARDVRDQSYLMYHGFGSGVNVYVIDSGIRTSHEEFEGRASVGFDAFGGTGQDCHGHGTHVAGIAGGKTYGVAKQVNLIAVRVLDCFNSGTVSGAIAGVDWVRGNRVAPAVVNMSLVAGASSTLDAAVNSSISSGITHVLAAGNNNQNACNASPARVAAGITVGASNPSDGRWVSSNFGTCLDLFAPGEGILSAGNGSDAATATMSGTSMAAPHVAGAAALYLGNYPTASPATVRNAILNGSNTGYMTNIGTGSPNNLLYVGVFWFI
jgi:subtilisin family serine protease